MHLHFFRSAIEMSENEDTEKVLGRLKTEKVKRSLFLPSFQGLLELMTRIFLEFRFLLICFEEKT